MLIKLISVVILLSSFNISAHCWRNYYGYIILSETSEIKNILAQRYYVQILDLRGCCNVKFDQLNFENLSSIEELYLGSSLRGNEEYSLSEFHTINLTTALRLPNLVKLDLSANKITEITIGVKTIEDIWPKIETLKLSENEISSIDLINLFPPSLRNLQLTYNNIRFGNISLINLEMIYLDKNNIQKLCGFKTNDCHGIRFTGSNKLIFLEFRNSSLKEIEVDAFHNIKNLKYLNLSRNKLKHIIPGTLTPLKELEELYISKNKLNKIPKFGLHNNFGTLKLNENKIKTIKEFAFEGLPNITYIDLNLNKINYIHPAAFQNLTALRILSLSNNNMKILSNNLITVTPLNISYVILENLLFSENLLCINVADNSFLAIPLKPTNTTKTGLKWAENSCYGMRMRCYNCGYIPEHMAWELPNI